MIDLHGLRILVTRPLPQGAALCRDINAQNGQAISLPTIAFQSMDNEPTLNLLGEQDWLIFISPQAVYSGVPLIRRRWPNLPPTVQFAAIGPGTGEALHEAGYVVALQPENNWHSEGLLALPALQHCQQQKIAIIRGVGGRERIEAVLTERGANVLSVIVYKRILPRIAMAEYRLLLQAGRIDVVIATSGEGVRNLKILCGETVWPTLAKIPLIVISERIKSLAHDLGFQTIWVAHDASSEAIIQMLSSRAHAAR